MGERWRMDFIHDGLGVFSMVLEPSEKGGDRASAGVIRFVSVNL